MDYEEKLSMLDNDDFVALFHSFGAEPRWVTSAGKPSIQILGLCHRGENHSALFDPDTLRVMCFSECNGAMLLHTWVKRTLDLPSPYEAKEKIMDWMGDQRINFSDRISRRTDFEYRERPYNPDEPVPMVPGIEKEYLAEIFEPLENVADVLPILEWATKDLILPEILDWFDVRWDEETGSILLPHHNINGEIVGIYERSFKPLRAKVKKEHPEMPYSQLVTYPRAKYVPLLKPERLRQEEDSKTSWSFPNSRNLYGLHRAAEHIMETGIAIIFEGGKSVMLSHQYGYPFAVATHTFGAHLNHITMLIECGATEIVLAFDKQYETEAGQAWELYEKKTRTLAKKVQSGTKDRNIVVTRIRDIDNMLNFKDAPTDQGEEVFQILLTSREMLTGTEAVVAALPKIEKVKNNSVDEAGMLTMLARINNYEGETRIHDLYGRPTGNC